MKRNNLIILFIIIIIIFLLIKSSKEEFTNKYLKERIIDYENNDRKLLKNNLLENKKIVNINYLKPSSNYEELML